MSLSGRSGLLHDEGRSRRSRMKGIWAALVALELTTTGCTSNPRPVEPAIRPAVERSAAVILHGKALDLHLSAPQGGPTADALVLYASGDGGWFGAAVDMFHRIGSAGYYTVGFSAKAFLKIDRRQDTPMNPEQLAAEYAADPRHRAPGAAAPPWDGGRSDRLVERRRLCGAGGISARRPPRHPRSAGHRAQRGRGSGDQRARG